jgi:hypothetical protein
MSGLSRILCEGSTSKVLQIPIFSNPYVWVILFLYGSFFYSYFVHFFKMVFSEWHSTELHVHILFCILKLMLAAFV